MTAILFGYLFPDEDNDGAQAPEGTEDNSPDSDEPNRVEVCIVHIFPTKILRLSGAHAWIHFIYLFSLQEEDDDFDPEDGRKKSKKGKKRKAKGEGKKEKKKKKRKKNDSAEVSNEKCNSSILPTH